MRDLSIFNASVKAGKMQVIEVDLRFGWPTYVRSIPFWESALLGQYSATLVLGSAISGVNSGTWLSTTCYTGSSFPTRTDTTACFFSC